MAITYLTGDATQPLGGGNKIIVHICNNIGGWGRGFVVAISKRWKEPEWMYRQWHAAQKGKNLPLGEIQLVQVEKDIWVCNMVAQHNIMSIGGVAPIRYEAIQDGLRQVFLTAQHLGASIHMPRIGCGLGGGVWDRVEPIIEEQLPGLDVTVYDLT